jgi:hypothetical protein
MAAPSRRQLILEAFVTRLEAITVDNGFQTDVGLNVFFGVAPDLGPDDPNEAVALVVGDDAAGYQGEHIVIELPVDVVALAKATLEEPWVAVEAVLSDIKKAVELEDRTLGQLVMRQIRRGSTRTLPRETGSQIVGASIRYLAPHAEVWGQAS